VTYRPILLSNPLRMRRILLSLLLVLLAPAGHALGVEFRHERLSVGEDRVRSLRARDMNGDGRTDLLAFSTGADGPAVHIFLAGERGDYAPTATLVLRPAGHGIRDVYYLFPALLDPERGMEIVLVDRLRGVVAFSLKAAGKGTEPVLSGPRRVADAPPLPFYPESGHALVLDAARDLDGDGKDELILPSAAGPTPKGAGYRILRAGREPEMLPTGAEFRLSEAPHRFFTLAWTFPRLTTTDWDADRIPDFVAAGSGSLLLYLQRRDGSFLGVKRRLDVLDPDHRRTERSTLSFADVNADGRADLLVTSCPTSVKVFERFSSRISLYLNPSVLSARKPGRFATPASTWKTRGVSVNPALLDFDRDGDLDVVVTALGLDLRSRIGNEFKASYSVHRFDPKLRGFEKDPYVTIQRPFPFRQLERNSTEPVCFFGGDFDGDGQNDLLDIADDGHVTILRGTSETDFLSSAKYVFKEPMLRLRARVRSDVLILDLNGDGASDMAGHDGGTIYLIRSVR